MRIKIIEKIIPISKLNLMIHKLFKSQFKFSESSITSDKSLLNLAIKEKKFIVVFHTSIDKNFKRTYLSCLVFITPILAKELNLKLNYSIRELEEKLINTIRKENKNEFLFPFTQLSKFQSNQIIKDKKRVFRLETKILNLLVKHIYKEFNYSDEIMKFPFSTIYLNNQWEEWEEIYFPYMELIEKGIINFNKDNIKLFRTYDFALKSDIFQRVIDLVIISSKPISEEEALTTEDLNLRNYEIAFIYCNRDSKPFKYINLLKFVNEIKQFSKNFKNDKLNKCYKIRISLILISQFGYDHEIYKYLRDHLIGETDYIIPLIVIPPNDDDIWHNFIDYKDLINSKPQKRKELERIINIGKSNSISDSYKNNMVKHAKSQYQELIEREKSVRSDYEFLNKWQLILDIPRSKEILKISKSDKKIVKKPRSINKNLFIY